MRLSVKSITRDFVKFSGIVFYFAGKMFNPIVGVLQWKIRKSFSTSTSTVQCDRYTGAANQYICVTVCEIEFCNSYTVEVLHVRARIVLK